MFSVCHRRAVPVILVSRVLANCRLVIGRVSEVDILNGAAQIGVFMAIASDAHGAHCNGLCFINPLLWSLLRRILSGEKDGKPPGHKIASNMFSLLSILAKSQEK